MTGKKRFAHVPENRKTRECGRSFIERSKEAWGVAHKGSC